MNRVSMHGVWAAAVLAVSCAGVPSPVTDLPDSPASPSAEEAPWNPQFRYLRYLETEVEAEASAPAMGGDMEPGHEAMQHAPPATGVDHDPPTESSGSSPGALGLGEGEGAAHQGHAMEQDHSSPPAEDATELSYVCPMHPELVREGPGTCPICGMELEGQPSPASEEDGR